MASESEVRKELVSEFKGFEKDSPFLDDCAKVGALLSGGYGPGPISKALTALETAMFQVIDDRLTPDAKKGITDKARLASMSDAARSGAFTSKVDGPGKVIGGQTSKLTITGNNPFKKVLVTALAKLETTANYPAENIDGSFHPRYVAAVSASDFLGNIANGIQWKDVGASPDHGEFTHRLQWLTVAASGMVPANTVGALYRKIGLCGFKADKPDSIKQTDLWARLFDRPLQRLSNGLIGAAQSNDDYRCPENFNTHLRAAGKTYPLLAAFLSARHAKRALVQGDTDVFPSQEIMKNYCAKKMFKESTYGQLQPLDKLKVDEVIKTGMLVA